MSLLMETHIVVFVFFVVAVILAPPDFISQIFLAVQMVIIYGVLRFIVSRFKSYAQTPENIKKLITVLICLLSITITSSIFFFQAYCGLNKSYQQMEDEHSK
jgi:prolipoprotein diacylglyceryltransferase